VSRRKEIYLAALPAGFIALLAGLSDLAVHPIAAVLLVLAAMALLIYLVAGVCQAPIFVRENQERNGNRTQIKGVMKLAFPYDRSNGDAGHFVET
jgi:hypothetical protein